MLVVVLPTGIAHDSMLPILFFNPSVLKNDDDDARFRGCIICTLTTIGLLLYSSILKQTQHHSNEYSHIDILHTTTLLRLSPGVVAALPGLSRGQFTPTSLTRLPHSIDDDDDDLNSRLGFSFDFITTTSILLHTQPLHYITLIQPWVSSMSFL